MTRQEALERFREEEREYLEEKKRTVLSGNTG